MISFGPKPYHCGPVETKDSLRGNAMFAYERQLESDFQIFLRELYTGNRATAENIRRYSFGYRLEFRMWFDRRVQAELKTLNDLLKIKGTLHKPDQTRAIA